MISPLKRLLAAEEGATALTYGLIAALISVSAIAAFGSLGEANTALYNGTAQKVSSKVDGSGGPSSSSSSSSSTDSSSSSSSGSSASKSNNGKSKGPAEQALKNASGNAKFKR